MLSPDSVIRPNEAEIASKVVDGEAIMINLSDGRYYSMQGAGGFIWTCITSGTTLKQLIGALTERYDAESLVVERDITGLVSVLLEEALVVHSDLPPVEIPSTGGATGRAPYEAAHLEVYTEMGELLALDPPLPGLEDIPWSGEEPAGVKQK